MNFIASELFTSGHKPFVHWTKAKRSELLNLFLRNIVSQYQLPLFYGAVDRNGFRQYLRRTVPQLQAPSQGHLNNDVQAVSFLWCVISMDVWLREHWDSEVAICILDESRSAQAQIKRILHTHRRLILTPSPMLSHIVDSAYFGKSNESFGLELADSCSFFIKRHLMGKVGDSEKFYELIEPQIVNRSPLAEFARVLPKNARRDGDDE